MGETAEARRSHKINMSRKSRPYKQHRTAAGPFNVALEGQTDGATPDRGAKHLAPYVQAGLTWWIEALGGWLGTPADALTRVRQGPPVQPPGE